MENLPNTSFPSSDDNRGFLKGTPDGADDANTLTNRRKFLEAFSLAGMAAALGSTMKVIADTVEKHEQPFTMEEAREILNERIVMTSVKNAKIHCGDDRAPEGAAAFGGSLMGIVYPVVKECERRAGRSLTDEELDTLFDCCETLIISHTDVDGLEHIADAIREHALLKKYFSPEQLEDLMHNGLNSKPIEELLQLPDAEKIIDALAAIFCHVPCQGCGHIVTLMQDEARESKIKNEHHHDALAAKLLNMHIQKNIWGSPRHSIAHYQHAHRGVGDIVLQTHGEIESEEDMIPVRTDKGMNRRTFFNQPQLTHYKIRTMAGNASRKFPTESWASDSKDIAMRAIAIHAIETAKTAHRLAASRPIFIATYTQDGTYDLKPGGTIA